MLLEAAPVTPDILAEFREDLEKGRWEKVYVRLLKTSVDEIYAVLGFDKVYGSVKFHGKKGVRSHPILRHLDDVQMVREVGVLPLPQAASCSHVRRFKLKCPDHVQVYLLERAHVPPAYT